MEESPKSAAISTRGSSPLPEPPTPDSEDDRQEIPPMMRESKEEGPKDLRPISAEELKKHSHQAGPTKTTQAWSKCYRCKSSLQVGCFCCCCVFIVSLGSGNSILMHSGTVDSCKQWDRGPFLTRVLQWCYCAVLLLFLARGTFGLQLMASWRTSQTLLPAILVGSTCFCSMQAWYLLVGCTGLAQRFLAQALRLLSRFTTWGIPSLLWSSDSLHRCGLVPLSSGEAIRL